MSHTTSGTLSVESPASLSVVPENEVLSTQETDQPEMEETEQDPNGAYNVKREVEKALHRFERSCGLQMDLNYRLATDAAAYVKVFLAAAPGIAMRSSATEILADASYRYSDDVFILSPKDGITKHRQRVNVLLSVHAVVSLIGDGSGRDKGATDSKSKRKGKDARLPWGKIREFSPLVQRKEDEHKEEWSFHPAAGQDGILAKELLDSVCSAPDMPAKDVREKVRSLRREYAVGMQDLEEAKRYGYEEPKQEAPASPQPAKEAGGEETEQEPESLTVEGEQPKQDAPSSGATGGAGATNSGCNQGTPLLEQLAASASKSGARDFAGLLLDAAKRHAQTASVMECLVEAFLEDPETDVDGWSIDLLQVIASHSRVHPAIKEPAQLARDTANEEMERLANEAADKEGK